jgi:hypothetical protein
MFRKLRHLLFGYPQAPVIDAPDPSADLYAGVHRVGVEGEYVVVHWRNASTHERAGWCWRHAPRGEVFGTFDTSGQALLAAAGYRW